jgi:hypothetical protein
MVTFAFEVERRVWFLFAVNVRFVGDVYSRRVGMDIVVVVMRRTRGSRKKGGGQVVVVLWVGD